MPRFSRSLSRSMGIDSEDFIKGLKAALNDDSIVKALKEVICKPLLTEMEQLKENIRQKDELILQLETKIELLELKQDDQEQYSRRNSLRIYGLQESDGENLMESLPNLLSKETGLDPPMQKEEICRVHRVGRKVPEKRPRPIILKFATYQARERLFKKRLLLKKSSALQSVFINEDLTKRRSRLLYDARMLKKGSKITDVWTKDGKIFIKSLNGKIVQIQNENQLGDIVKK